MAGDLSSFAELIKQANEDKKLRLLAETQRKNNTVVPLLSELFSSVAKAKEIHKESAAINAPLLEELRTALINPEKVKQEKQKKKQKIVDLVTELEKNTANTQSELIDDTPDIDVKIDAAIAEADKRFLKLYNRLQNDLQTLKRHIDSKPSTIIQQGTSGGGEVRILRMDDMDKTAAPAEGDTLVWSSTSNKFELKPLGTVSAITTDEEMPFAKRVDFITDSEIYKGEAAVGTLEDSPNWRIRKVTIGLDSDVSETWANGSSQYNKRWSDRLTYNYI